mgnify:CR=1 FL=1
MGRLQKTINRDWMFHRGDCPEAWYRGYDDAPEGSAARAGAWQAVTLPHDWSVSEPFSPEHSSGGGYLPGGIGWYRGRFALPEECRGKKVWLVFDGVYSHARVWANSHHLGEWPGGYTTFTHDISHAARFGDEENVIAVRVEHAHTADSRWYTGSGIYRKVSVLVTEPVYIGQYGVFFSTPEADADSARIAIETRVHNETGASASGVIRHTLRDPGGRAVAVLETPCEIPAGESATIAQEGRVEGPALWAPAHPALYTLTTELLVAGAVMDSETQRVGIRTARFTADEGFALNGEPLVLKGVCVHHDAGTLGAAVHPKVWRRRLEALHGAGCNAIRMSHNPHMPELYDLCDELGFLVIDEAFDEWEGPKNKWWQGHNVYPPKLHGYYEDFPAWHERDLSLLVQRDRNHPSVILWSIGNEIDYPNDPYGHPYFQTMTGNNDANKPAEERRYSPDRPNAERLLPLARRLREIVRRWDSTRPVTAAVAFPELSNLTGYCDVLDVVGYNYKEERYGEDHARYPERPLLGSENGGHYAAWRAVRDHPYIAGQFLWTGVDYLGEARGWPVHGSPAGLLTTAGYPKAAYHFRRSLWLDEPVIQLMTSRPLEPDSPLLRGLPPGARAHVRRLQERPSWSAVPGESIAVTCYTNCPEVELRLNGRPLRTFQLAAFPETGCIETLVPFEPGKLEAVGRAADGTLARSTLVTEGAPAALRAQAWGGAALAADGEDLAQIEIQVLDGAGRPVPGATDLLGVIVEGPGVLLALDGGDLADTTPCSSPERRACDGRLIAYVRSTGEAGTVRVHCHARGALRPADVWLEAR